MSTRNPMEECPPDEIIKKLTIECVLVGEEPRTKRRGSGPRWRIRIPEIKFEIHTSNLTKTLAIELARIEEANEELIIGEKAWHKDEKMSYQTFKSARFPDLGYEDHDKRQKEILKKKWPSVSPAETMTPGRDIRKW